MHYKAIKKQIKQDLEFTVPELLSIANQLPTAGIMTLEEMGQFIDAHTSGQLFKLNTSKKASSVSSG